MAELLKVGDDATEILKQAGVDNLVGKKNIVFYFYPKDFTAGCTQEAQDFRDAREKFDAVNTEIVGISSDSTDSHGKFTDRYKLNFTLISDTKHEIAAKCGTAGVLGMDSRTTYLIDRQGKVRYVWPKVHVGGHADDVLAKVKELGLG